jgi:hypothetical protein
MTYALKVIEGMAFGVGLILAAAAMKVAFHLQMC